MARAAVEARLPISLVEARPGRELAVHRRAGATNKPALFFVHGSCASMLQYEPLIARFASSGHEVIAYDYLGCGRSPKPNAWYAYAFEELYLDLNAIIERFGADKKRKNVLICHSAGCALGLMAAARAAPDAAASVDGLCLLAPVSGLPNAHPLFYLPVFVLNRLQPTMSAAFEGLALHQKTRDGVTEARQSVLALAKDVNSANPMHMCKAYYRQGSRGAPTSDEVRAAGQRVPIVVLSGSDDGLLPPGTAEAVLALLPAATTHHVVADTSHQLMQEEPEVVGKHIEAFVAQLVSRGGVLGGLFTGR